MNTYFMFHVNNSLSAFFNTIKSYLMLLTTRSYGPKCFWHSLVACWPFCSAVA